MELRLVYPAEYIARAVQSLAADIEADYAGRYPVLLVVLKGSFVFAADLVRCLRLPLTVEFVSLSSYSGTKSRGEVQVDRLPGGLAGRDLLVVEDIVDTGLSLSELLERLQSQNPASLRVCTLLDKRERRRVPVSPDYVGISTDAGFLVGYGLDLDGRFRELPAIYELVSAAQPMRSES